MKKCLILTVSITIKMIVYGPVNREEANRRDGKKQQRKFPRKVMVWSEGVAPLVLFEKDTLDHHRYVKKVLPVALRYGNNWTFQQDNGTPHTHQEMQE